jgi:hypothetical protein
VEGLSVAAGEGAGMVPHRETISTARACGMPDVC